MGVAMMFARLAIEADRQSVLDLGEEYFHEANAEMKHLGFRREIADATFSAALQSAEPTIFVVEKRGEVVGFLLASMQSFRFDSGFFAYNELMYVKPEYRGTRAAASLLKQFSTWSDRIGAKFALGGNQNGLYTERTARLYEKFGFSRVGLSLLKFSER